MQKRWPNLFIVGAPKAGTTSLHYYLGQHPDVYMSPMKEPHYFSRISPDPGFAPFLPHISEENEYLRIFRGGSSELFIGESSGSYLGSEEAARGIKSASPDARIIAILREPASRAYSEYLNNLRSGLDKRRFLDSLVRDWNSARKGWGISFGYVERGLYSAAVLNYIRVFGCQKVRVLVFEEMIANPCQELDGVFRFLGLDPRHAYEIGLENRNPFSMPRHRIFQRLLGSGRVRELFRAVVPRRLRTLARHRLMFPPARRPEMERTAKEFLCRIYAEDVARLREVLCRDLPWPEYKT